MTRLQRDQHGAIMLLGVFMAVFLTAALYYVVGIGESVLQREHMQDAADAAAFSAATLHARGMNLLVLINMVMAALLAVLVTLKLVEALLTIALVIISVASIWAWGLASAIPGINSARDGVRNVHATLEPPINVALQTLNVVGISVRSVVPVLGMVRVMELVDRGYRPQVSGGVAAGARLTLPTEDGKFSELCDRAGGYVSDLVDLTLSQGIPQPVSSLMSGAVKELVSAGADWFCGTGGSAPPTTTISHKIYYPKIHAREVCEAHKPESADYDEDAHARDCEQADREEKAAMPNETTGECIGGEAKCGLGSTYEQRDAAARIKCAPRAEHDNRLREFRWQAHHITNTYVYRKRKWQLQTSVDVAAPQRPFTYEKSQIRPCGNANASISPKWNAEQRDSATGEFVPLCSNAVAATDPGREGQTIILEQIEVLRIFGCMEKKKLKHTLSEENQKGRVGESDTQDTNKKVPQVLLPGIELGEEDFQLRAIVFGALPPEGPEGVLKVATWSAEDPTGWNAVRALGHGAVAQAEFYYDVEGAAAADPADFMWNMRWKARLRRFRLPERKPVGKQESGADVATGVAETPQPSLHDACLTVAGGERDEKGGSPCDALDPTLSDLIIH